MPPGNLRFVIALSNGKLGITQKGLADSLVQVPVSASPTGPLSFEGQKPITLDPLDSIVFHLRVGTGAATETFDLSVQRSKL
jgi:hypothetical protein